MQRCEKDKRKQKLSKNMAEPSKRGRRMEKEIIDNLFEFYSVCNPPQIQNVIQGWERESNNNEEDIEAQEKNMDLVVDLGNTRGCLSLFHQSIHTYWTLQCVLAKALQSSQESEGSPVMVLILHEIKKEI